jgi:hypothetical protein
MARSPRKRIARPIRPGQVVRPVQAAPAAGPVVRDRRYVRIAAFGDSLMWGQGLNRNDRFTALIAKEIGRRVKRIPQIVYDRSRSGAKITGRATKFGTDAMRFVDYYPHLFPGGRGITAFLRGQDA